MRYYWHVASPTETDWLRVSTPYSGHGKGQLFTPEVGSQVLVGYEQGLAEFPVVLGNLFHPKTPKTPPTPLPSTTAKACKRRAATSL